MERRTQLPVAEVQHRVRNVLALVGSVVRRTAQTADTVENYVMHLEGRLGAIARGQDMALWRAGETGIDLEYLVAEELLTHGAREGPQVSVMGPPIELRNAAAALLGLAFHELAVNSVKYGALSNANGRVAVQWHLEAKSPASVHILWHETVGTAPPAEKRRAGFGTELIERTLAYDLDADASLVLDQQEVRCHIVLPLTADIVAPQPEP